MVEGDKMEKVSTGSNYGSTSLVGGSSTAGNIEVVGSELPWAFRAGAELSCTCACPIHEMCLLHICI